MFYSRKGERCAGFLLHMAAMVLSPMRCSAAPSWAVLPSPGHHSVSPGLTGDPSSTQQSKYIVLALYVSKVLLGTGLCLLKHNTQLSIPCTHGERAAKPQICARMPLMSPMDLSPSSAFSVIAYTTDSPWCHYSAALLVHRGLQKFSTATPKTDPQTLSKNPFVQRLIPKSEGDLLAASLSVCFRHILSELCLFLYLVQRFMKKKRYSYS